MDNLDNELVREQDIRAGLLHDADITRSYPKKFVHTSCEIRRLIAEPIIVG